MSGVKAPPEPRREFTAAGNPITAHNRSTFTNHGCRCPECRSDWAAYCKASRERRRSAMDAGVASPVHGTDQTYLNYSCRCGPCTDAHRVDELRRAHERKARR